MFQSQELIFSSTKEHEEGKYGNKILYNIIFY